MCPGNTRHVRIDAKQTTHVRKSVCPKAGQPTSPQDIMSDKPITMKELEILMRAMMKDLAHTDEVKEMTVQAKIERAEDKVATDIINTSSTAQSSSSVAPPADDGWRPRVVHVRGWAPFGCSATHKLNKKEAIDFQAEIDKRLTEEWKDKARCMGPLVMSHSLSLEILDASCTDAKRLADKLNLSFAASPLNTKGSPCGAACERSPALRRLLAMWCSNRDIAVAPNGPKITKCPRALEIY